MAQNVLYYEVKLTNTQVKNVNGPKSDLKMPFLKRILKRIQMNKKRMDSQPQNVTKTLSVSVAQSYGNPKSSSLNGKARAQNVESKT